MKVLIADGSTMVAARLINAMREIPNVEMLAHTCDPQTTLESIRTNNPEILIADVRIGGDHGSLFFQTIRRERPEMILIILSNAVYPQSQKHYEAAGADLFMDKSNEFIRLQQFVRELAGGPAIPINKSHENGIRDQLAAGKLKVGLQLVLLAISVAGHFISF